MSNLSDLSDFPTFISCTESEAHGKDVLFICRSSAFTREHYNIVFKPSLSDILFDLDNPYAIEDNGKYSFEFISIGQFIKGLIAGHQKYVDILNDVKAYCSKAFYFRQYKDGLEIVDGCINGRKVYTTLDFILLLDKSNKLNEGILKYLLEIEYGIKQVEMVELFNLTCTKYE